MKSIAQTVNNLTSVVESSDPELDIRHLKKFENMLYAIAEDIVHAGLAGDIASQNFSTFNKIYISLRTTVAWMNGIDVAERITEILAKYDFVFRDAYGIYLTRIDDMTFVNNQYNLEIVVDLLDTSRQILVLLRVKEDGS